MNKRKWATENKYSLWAIFHPVSPISSFYSFVTLTAPFVCLVVSGLHEKASQFQAAARQFERLFSNPPRAYNPSAGFFRNLSR